MKFPHISDSTSFPDVSNVNTYRFKNNFDYKRWDAGTTLKLLNVNWGKDDGNVVKFKDDEERDAWFDKASGHLQKLDSQARIMDNNTVKVPLPFDECSKFNYLMIDISTATSDYEKIDYETNKHMRRFFFFVLDYEEIAPNTTRLYIDIDVWTTYINRIEIGNMLLERGHAPMSKAADVDTYLSCPIDNTEYLLADDYDFGGESKRSTYNDFVPYGSGEKYILFASNINPLSLYGISAVGYDETESGYSIGDDSAIDGYVDSYNRKGTLYKPGKDAKANVNVSATELTVGNTVGYRNSASQHDNASLNGYTIYMMRASLATSTVNGIDVSKFPSQVFPDNATRLDYMAFKYPQFVESIAAMWIVPSSMVDTHTATVYIGGDSNLPMQVANKVEAYTDIRLNKSDFKYEAPYDTLTKLYTSPYAELVLSDNEGRTVEIGIERTAPVKIASRISIAYPCIKFTALLCGVDSSDDPKSYVWKSIDGKDVTSEIPSGSFYDFMFSYDIPTYALFENGYVNYSLHNYNSINRANKAALENSYDSKVRNANVSQFNSLRGYDTGYANSVHSAETWKTNENASAATSATITKASADNTYTNTMLDSNNALTNTNTSADNTYSVTKRSIDNEKLNSDSMAGNSLINATAQNENAYNNIIINNEKALNETTYNNKLAMDDFEADLLVSGEINQLKIIENIAENVHVIMSGAVNAATSSVPQIASVNGGGSSELVGLALNGVGTALSTLWAYGMSTETFNVISSGNRRKRNIRIADKESGLASLSDLSWDGGLNGNGINKTLTILETNASSTIATNNKNVANSVANNTNTTIKNINVNNQNTNTENANDNKATIKNIAKRTFDTISKISDNNKSVAYDNADRTYNNSVANAQRKYETDLSNLKASLNANVDNAKAGNGLSKYGALRDLDAAISEIAYKAMDHRLDEPKKVCEQSGDFSLDEYGMRGLTVRVKTERPDEYKQAGDMFFRYGYAYNRNWHFEGFNVMKHFTYWKCSDVWLVGSAGVIEEAQSTIRDILINGVTVWSNPDEIGSVSIYDN